MIDSLSTGSLLYKEMNRNQTNEPMIVIQDNQENCPKEAVKKIESKTGISEEDGSYK